MPPLGLVHGGLGGSRRSSFSNDDVFDHARGAGTSSACSARGASPTVSTAIGAATLSRATSGVGDDPDVGSPPLSCSGSSPRAVDSRPQSVDRFSLQSPVQSPLPPEVEEEEPSACKGSRLSSEQLNQQFQALLGPPRCMPPPEVDEAHSPRMFAGPPDRRLSRASTTAADGARRKSLLSAEEGHFAAGVKEESYAERILRQQDNRDALTAAAEEKMARDAAIAAEMKHGRRFSEEESKCNSRYNSDGVYRNLPRVQAKVEVLKGLRWSFLNGDMRHDKPLLATME